MIGDQQYTEALEVRAIRPAHLVGERSNDCEAMAEAVVEFLEVRMQT